MEEQQTIKFSNLSTDLKVLVVIGWILIGLNILAFMFGFYVGMTEL